MKPSQKKKRVVSKEVAYIVKEILTQPVIGSHGTATYCKIAGVDVAAKTGTTDENYDRWLCGFTPYYTAVTWYGYDENESIEYNKRNPAGLLWANVMSRIHTGLNSATFEKPSAISSCTICAETGKKATTGCPNTYTEYFLWLTIPDLCGNHTGSEFKQDTNHTTPNKVEEIIQGITQDIDAVDPQQVPQSNPSTNNTNTNTSQNQSSNTVTTNNTAVNHKNNTNTNNSNNKTNTNLSNNTNRTNTGINNNTVNKSNTNSRNPSNSSTNTATNKVNTNR